MHRLEMANEESDNARAQASGMREAIEASTSPWIEARGGEKKGGGESGWGEVRMGEQMEGRRKE